MEEVLGVGSCLLINTQPGMVCTNNCLLRNIQSFRGLATATPNHCPFRDGTQVYVARLKYYPGIWFTVDNNICFSFYLT